MRKTWSCNCFGVKLAYALFFSQISRGIFLVLSDDNLPNIRRLSISEFNSILFSEADNEFGAYFLPNDEVEERWQDAITYGWNHAFQMESLSIAGEVADRKLKNDVKIAFHTNTTLPDLDIDIIDNALETLMPFMSCCEKKLEKEERCIETIKQHFGKKIIPLYNHDHKVCVIVSSNASLAIVAPVSLSVTPLIPETKLLEGTVETIEKTANLVKQINIMLCPAFQHDNATRSAGIIKSLTESLIYENKTKGLHRYLRIHGSESNLERSQSKTKNQKHHRSMLWSRILDQTETDSHDCNNFKKSIRVTSTASGSFVILSVNNAENVVSSSAAPFCLLSVAASLATKTEVCSISIEPPKTLFNEKVQWILQSGQENKRPWFDHGIDGTGQVVGLSDSGLDIENCYFHDDSLSDFEKDGRVYSDRRKVVQYLPYADDSDMSSGHGTHVAGTIAGFRQSKNPGENGRGDGIAKGAKLAFFDVATSDGMVSMPHDPRDIFLKANEAHAFIHSVSWGSPGSIYMHDETSIDSYLYDNPDNLICAAAGNFGRKGDMSLASPSTAKNVLSVGSTFSKDSELDSVTAFSSRGPTSDGRMKPEVMAPGDSILSARAVPSTPGACDDNGGLKYAGGTSMSSPAVCGAAAIVRQYFEDGFYSKNTGDSNFVNPPSGPLIKAVLINGANALTSNHDMHPINPYDNNQGFGRVSLIDSLPLKNINKIKAKVVNRKEIASNSVDTYRVSIDKSDDCDLPLSVSLVWYDPPSGVGCTRCLLNNLNLFLTSDSKTYYSNGMKFKDDINNSERVQIVVEDGDEFLVHIEATDLITDVQLYAMVISGCLGNVESTTEEKKKSNIQYEIPNLVLW